jgi:tight adherence protein B
MTRRLIVAALAVAAAAIATAPAHASSGSELSEAAGRAFPHKAFVLTLPERRVLQPGDVSVRENGQPVDRLRVVPGDAVRTFGAVLVIDTSLSMRGTPMAAAMDAARRFAARRPPQQRLGVVFFNRTARVALAPTRDAAKIAAVLASPPKLSKGTHVHDATALALSVLADAKLSARSLVLLSDGADVGSAHTPGQVARAARATKTRVFTIGLRSRSYDGSALRRLAAATHGRYAEADERQLAPLFAALGRRFNREYLITYRSLAALSSKIDVSVRVAGIPGAALASYTAPALHVPAKRAQPPSHAQVARSNKTLAIGAAVVALLLGLAAFAIVRPARRTLRTRIAEFTGDAVPEADDPLLAVGDASTAPTARRHSRLWLAFAEDVDVAGYAISPERLLAWTLLASAISVGSCIVLGRPLLAPFVLAKPLIMRLVVRARADRVRREFESQLADNLQVIASAMRAGQSFPGALAVAVEDAAEPARSELQRTVTDERLGVALDEALGRAARRMRSEELEYVGLVATLQRDTGGNTAEVLDRVTDTIRERAELKRLVRTLTAQGRLGGAIVSAIPVALTAIFLAIRPDYFDPLFESSIGIAVIVLGASMLVAGWLVIRKIVDIEV